MQKEEKQLELYVEALIQRVGELKNSIASFLMKLEHEYETLNWPRVLDSFALLSGQLNSLSRVLKSDKVPALRNHVLLPLVLLPERDAELEKLTEGRVMMFNHEVVPGYLRTKLEPEVEEKIGQLTTKTNGMTQEAAQVGDGRDRAKKQLNNLNKITSNLLDIMNSAKEEWENESSQKSSQPQTTSVTETNLLISATLFGKNLKPVRPRTSEGTATSAAMATQSQTQQKSQGSKAPSTIKTQIKAASGNHPYQRP